MVDTVTKRLTGLSKMGNKFFIKLETARDTINEFADNCSSIGDEELDKRLKEVHDESEKKAEKEANFVIQTEFQKYLIKKERERKEKIIPSYQS